MIPLALLALVVAFVAVQAIVRRHVERAVTRRLPPGPSGIIGGAEPIRLDAPAARAGILLLHGFGDTPQALRGLADTLRARELAVHAPLLPGHGRSLRAFRASDAREWRDAARAAYVELAERYDHVGVVGLSMGGALAALLAASRPEVFALALLAPYLVPPHRIRMLARSPTLVAALAPYIVGEDPRSIHDPVARAASLGYGAFAPHQLAALVALADEASAALPRITAPTLYVQSREDNRLSSAGAERSFAALGSREKRLAWVEGCGHVITVDYCWREVAEMVGDWMEMHVGSGARVP